MLPVPRMCSVAPFLWTYFQSEAVYLYIAALTLNCVHRNLMLLAKSKEVHLRFNWKILFELIIKTEAFKLCVAVGLHRIQNVCFLLLLFNFLYNKQEKYFPFKYCLKIYLCKDMTVCHSDTQTCHQHVCGNGFVVHGPPLWLHKYARGQGP
jgi:hypothetical protein